MTTEAHLQTKERADLLGKLRALFECLYLTFDEYFGPGAPQLMPRTFHTQVSTYLRVMTLAVRAQILACAVQLVPHLPPKAASKPAPAPAPKQPVARAKPVKAPRPDPVAGDEPPAPRFARFAVLPPKPKPYSMFEPPPARPPRPPRPEPAFLADMSGVKARHNTLVRILENPDPYIMRAAIALRDRHALGQGPVRVREQLFLAPAYHVVTVVNYVCASKANAALKALYARAAPSPNTS